MGDRPAVYVHFELGVSWPKHLSKDRHITYISKSMRDRANQFPRQLPPVNTNYLAAPTQYQVAYQQPVPQIQEPQAHPPYQLTYYTNEIPPNTYNRDPVTPAPAQTVQYQPYQPVQQPQHYSQEYYAPVASVQPPVEEEEVRGSSRSMSRSSHERGRSAPPPFNDSPWDVGSSSNSQGVPQLWKALPATPNQYRLGEDNMPWSTWSFPMGYNENEDEGDDGERGESRSREASIRATWGPEFPGEPARRPESDDRHRGKAKDIQSLATALMTVDNGFEDQWWYQGPRLVNLHGTVLVPTAVPKSSFHPDFQQGSVGWAVSREEEMRQKDQLQQHQQRQHQQQQQQQQRQQLESFVPSTPSFQVVSPRSSVADIVSPLSEYPSPLSSFGGLRRSLTTRSDELHM
ncbi:uncharacterized protein NECHADRAFT_92385 [Fusarium vanettenii 77-13-4]|uniref:Uncharacterized protein n=1 Tax=Fusarium vanettenii (strain ATCC MYA-4622 / CBS 123669 / FGSC 9596 / NRRL 45880 / 77-13-4) TaxID=660122 RepID=C7ZLT8_FUSV7|nr:uncharacterized protein NECHADRAFT_92385 [Fusarium vanettenii 77-13-4]EEU35018.1 hypothetical protein NECHADRAFT_92385 [Fusarium vanettenii 77-13-4]